MAKIKLLTMRKLTDRQMEILTRITELIDTEEYYSFSVKQRPDGIYLVPDEARFIGDNGEFMGKAFEQAKANIGEFVNLLMEN